MDAVPLPAPAPAYVPAGISPLLQALVDREAVLRSKKDAEVDKANSDVSKISRYDAELADLVSRQDRLQSHELECFRISARVAEETRLTREADLGIANANVAAGVPRDEVVEERRTCQHRDLNRNYDLVKVDFNLFSPNFDSEPKQQLLEQAPLLHEENSPPDSRLKSE